MAAHHAQKTHCVNGHPFDEENTCFFINSRTGSVNRRCRTCGRRRSRASAWKNGFKRTYGVSREYWADLFAAQDGRCVICRKPQDGPWGLSMDHDHACCPGKKSCGKCIRGLLCSKCNSGLGFFDDDIRTLRAAASYLARTS